MKRQKQMRKAFGINEFGLVDFPVKISNVQVSRIVYGNERGCSWCFPHEWETDNSTVANRQRTWKRFRKTSWKTLKKKGRIAPAFRCLVMIKNCLLEPLIGLILLNFALNTPISSPPSSPKS